MKTSLKRALFIAGTAGTTLSTAVILFLLVGWPVQGAIPKSASPASQAPPLNLTSGPAAAANPAAGLPLRLLIPKINVNAAIESVGLTKDRAVGVPKIYANTAWFNVGPRPGETGSAIINGHYGWIKGRPLVFNNLSKLRVGDKIYVKDKTGAMVVFVVRKLQTYSLKDDATEVFSANDSSAHLNLITCEGVWDKVSKSYSRRLVVFTDKI